MAVSDIEAGRTALVWARIDQSETVEGLLNGLWDYWHVLISQLPDSDAAKLVRYLTEQAPARDLVMLSLERLRAVPSLERNALIDVLAAALPRLKTQRWRFALQCINAIASLVRLEFDTANPPQAADESDGDESDQERAKAPRFAANVLNEPKAAPVRDLTTATKQWQSQLRLLHAVLAMKDLSEGEVFLARGLCFRLLADALLLHLPVDVEAIALALLPAAAEPHLLFETEAFTYAPCEEGEEDEIFTTWSPDGVAYAAALLLPRLPAVLSPMFLFRVLAPHVNTLLRIQSPMLPAESAPPSAAVQPTVANANALGEELYTALLRPLIGRNPLLTLRPIDDEAMQQQSGEAGRLQAVINFVVNCPLQARRTALWKVLATWSLAVIQPFMPNTSATIEVQLMSTIVQNVRGQVSLYDQDTRLRLLRFLLRHCPYGHVSALLLGWVKDDIARTPPQTPETSDNTFIKELRSFFPLVFQSRRAGEELEHFDQLMASANFARFLLLWDKQKQVLTADNLRDITDVFLEPLRMSLTAQLASPLPNAMHRTNLQVLADVCDRTIELLRAK